MEITRAEVERIAGLARIDLAEEEKIKMGKELSAILDFVEKLREAPTRNVPLLAGGAPAEDELRPDEQTEKSLEHKQAGLLEQVPAKKDGWLKVKAIFN